MRNPTKSLKILPWMLVSLLVFPGTLLARTAPVDELSPTKPTAPQMGVQPFRSGLPSLPAPEKTVTDRKGTLDFLSDTNPLTPSAPDPESIDPVSRPVRLASGDPPAYKLSHKILGTGAVRQFKLTALYNKVGDYRLESSSDLIHWTLVAAHSVETLTGLGANTRINTDTMNSSIPMRFYRIVPVTHANVPTDECPGLQTCWNASSNDPDIYYQADKRNFPRSGGGYTEVVTVVVHEYDPIKGQFVPFTVFKEEPQTAIAGFYAGFYASPDHQRFVYSYSTDDQKTNIAISERNTQRTLTLPDVRKLLGAIFSEDGTVAIIKGYYETVTVDLRTMTVLAKRRTAPGGGGGLQDLTSGVSNLTSVSAAPRLLSLKAKRPQSRIQVSLKYQND